MKALFGRLNSWLNGVLAFLAAQRDELLETAGFASRNGSSKTILRIGTSGLFYAADGIASKLFDYLLFPYVMINFPWYYSIPLLTVCNFFYCFGFINLYDYIDADALVLEDIKGIRDYQGKSLWRRMLGWGLRKGSFFAFLALAIVRDPTYVVIYFRDSNKKYSGIQDKRSWKFFLGSLPINMWWCFPSLFMGVYGSPIASYYWALYGASLTWFAMGLVTLFVLCCALWFWLIINQKEHF